MEFKGIVKLLNPGFSEKKEKRISILVRELPSFKKVYDKYIDKKIIDKRIEEEKSKTDGLTAKEPLEEIKKSNETIDHEDENKKSWEGDSK